MEFQRPDIERYGKLAALTRSYVAGQVEVTSACSQHCKGCESWRDHATGKQRGEWGLVRLAAFCSDLLEGANLQHLSLTGGDPQDWEPLEDFIEFYIAEGWDKRFGLQVNTAMRKPAPPALWSVLSDVRVSLDAIDPAVYAHIRGDKTVTPEQIIQNVEALKHPRVQFNTMVCPDNLSEIPKIIEAAERMATPPRKLSFLAVIGDRYERSEEFWKLFNGYAELYATDEDSAEPLTSFSENPHKVRAFLQSQEAKAIPCYAGAITFHAKANGDLYPCCLAGGEAINTYEQLKLGNVFERSVLDLMRSYNPRPHYSSPGMPCREICQWKQLTLNIAGYRASKTRLSMP